MLLWPTHRLLCLIAVLYIIGSTTAQQCPVDLRTVQTVPEGCPCNPTPSLKFGMCSSGFVCAEPWAGDMLRQAAAQPPGQQLPISVPPINLQPVAGAATPHFVCLRCSYGQYCPKGSVLPSTSSPLIQMVLTSLACPAGTYCPNPAEALPCGEGSFCAIGTVDPVTCNISTLVANYPGLMMPSRPTTVYESVYARGTALAGNQCPANSSTPTNPCQPGYYCPSPAQKLVCPEGYYCKSGSQAPSKCPILANCPAGSAKGSLSWVGFITLAGILLALWLSYKTMITVIRMNQRKLGRTQEARERLWKLLDPLFASQHHSRSHAFRAFKAIRPKINVEFDDLGMTLHDGTFLLSGVSGQFRHSRVTAVMGPSGAGKSTFLNCIMGKAKGVGKVTGRIRVNGREMSPDGLREIMGFVPQEDIVHEDLTVRENLVYSARLRLSTAKPVREQLAIVDDVISVLQLKHVQHNLVGSAERRGISGGQRKRVNIGWELVAKPSVLYMDEPTSGLDATAAADIVEALKRMAGLGMNIITVIHQPRFSIFSLFDDVMLLCKGGRLAYLGPSRLALPYLESVGFELPRNENPADFAMDVLSGSVPRAGAPAFQPEELVPLWLSHGLAWVQAHSATGAVDSSLAARPAPEAVDPEQLRLLERQFDDVDADTDGAISGSELRALLVGLGLEPTEADVKMITAELAEPQSGFIRKEGFMQYVRYGGRPPTADASPKGGSKRRVDSLYRVYSIEQYSLGAALAEMAASQLPTNLKAGGTLKDMAAAVVTGQGGAASGALRRRTLTMTAVAGGVPQGDHTAAVGTTIPEDEDLTDGSAPREAAARSTSSGTDSVSSLQIPPASPTAQSAPGRDCTSLRASSMLHDVGAVQLPQRGLWFRTLACCGLEAGSGSLRSTPGVFGQLTVLFTRAGVKWARNWTTKFTDLLLLIFAAVTCGAMHGTGSDPNDIRGHTALTMLTLGIISATTSLSVFGRDKLVFWREQASGVAVLPYFLANSAINLVDVALQPLIFLSIYQSMTLPAINFGLHYLVGVLVVWWCSSAGCLVSMLVGQPANALVAAVAVVMVAGGFINGVSPNYRDLSPGLKTVTSLSFNRWAVEAVVIGCYENFPRYVWPLTKALVNMAGYCGLDSSAVPPISGTGKVLERTYPSDAPIWDDKWQQQDKGTSPPLIHSAQLEQQDISVYCHGYMASALLALALEGLILRLLTLAAMYVCPRGLTLEPLILAVGSAVNRFRSWCRRRGRRAQAASAATAAQPTGTV